MLLQYTKQQLFVLYKFYWLVYTTIYLIMIRHCKFTPQFITVHIKLFLWLPETAEYFINLTPSVYLMLHNAKCP